MRPFLYGLAVIPGLALAAVAVAHIMRLTEDLRQWSARTSRRRYAYPDREWRRPFRHARYSIGLWFLKPYLARTGAALVANHNLLHGSNITAVLMPGQTHTAEETAANKRRQHKLVHLDGRRRMYLDLLNLDGPDAYGDNPVLSLFTHDHHGWPKRFHILTPTPRPWVDEN